MEIILESEVTDLSHLSVFFNHHHLSAVFPFSTIILLLYHCYKTKRFNGRKGQIVTFVQQNIGKCVSREK